MTISELKQTVSTAKSGCFDRLIRDFIRRFPDATIVNIGCGPDTPFELVNNPMIMCYYLDPEFMETGKLLLNETVNRRFIFSSFLDNDWYKHIDHSEHILFVARGVYYYYEQKVIRTFFIRLSQMFPACELLFDVVSPAGVWIANRGLMITGTDKKKPLKWGLKNTDTILSWSPRLKFMGKNYIYREKGITMSFINRILGFISDTLDIYYIVHFKIRVDYKQLRYFITI